VLKSANLTCWEALDVLLDIASSPTPQTVLSLSFGGMEKTQLPDDSEFDGANINATLEAGLVALFTTFFCQQYDQYSLCLKTRSYRSSLPLTLCSQNTS
jgi:hypothetical protein